MTRLFKAGLCAVGALLATAAIAVTAQASEQISSSTTATVATSPSLVFTASSAIGNISITCRVELESTISSEPIPNTAGALVGRVTAVRIANASNGERLCDSNVGLVGVEVLNLPWHIRLVRLVLGERGTLVVLGASFNLTLLNLGFSCLYGDDVNADGELVGGSTLTTLQTDQDGIPLVSGGIFCPSTGGLEGVFNLSPTITLTLI